MPRQASPHVQAQPHSTVTSRYRLAQPGHTYEHQRPLRCENRAFDQIRAKPAHRPSPVPVAASTSYTPPPARSLPVGGHQTRSSPSGLIVQPAPANSDRSSSAQRPSDDRYLEDSLRYLLVTAGVGKNLGAGQRHDLTAIHNPAANNMTAVAAIASHGSHRLGVHTQ